ncbi:MAG: hypothetical protein LBF91_04525, partial [Azoarcus sp.]|nr:hypothetical protein [Azoarcus sp.]
MADRISAFVALEGMDEGLKRAITDSEEVRGGVRFFPGCAASVESCPRIARRCEMAGYLFGGTTPPW